VRDVLLIMKREFKERVASRSFVLGTLLFPLLVIAIVLLPGLVGSRGAEWTLALVNEAPPALGETFQTALAAPPSAPEENTYRVVPVDPPFDAVREQLAARVQARELDGYVVLPADITETGTILFRARNVGSFAVGRDLRRAATLAVQQERLRASGIQAADVAAIVAPVELDEARLTARGEERGGAFATFLTAYLVAFLIYLMTTLYGVAVMRSVLEEKTNRIAEVLMSTIRASHLMAGKIIGVGSAAVAQVLIWIAITAIIVSQSDRLGERFALPDPVLQALRIEPATGVLLFLFFLLGFFLYAAIFAMVGAAVTSEQEAQSVQFLALTPLIVPLMFLQTILNAPLGATAVTLGILPFTAPITMPMRMASVPVPPLEILVSLALLVMAIAAVAWVAGKIYRVGILSTGKRPSVTELVRWVRSA
jgi:ABC-2 type transport system permease protein